MNLINVEKAVELLKAGELVIVPTDTVYGIACNSGNIEAVKKIFQIKGRLEGKPLIVLISSLEMLNEVAEEVGDKHRKLIERFWPGALTLIFRKSAKVSDLIVAGGATIGVRMPAQLETLAIIEGLGRPIVATSVNKSGLDHLVDLEKIAAEFPGLAIVESAKAGVGVESTVLDLSGGEVKVLRQGMIAKEEIENILGEKII